MYPPFAKRLHLLPPRLAADEELRADAGIPRVAALLERRAELGHDLERLPRQLARGGQDDAHGSLPGHERHPRLLFQRGHDQGEGEAQRFPAVMGQRTRLGKSVLSVS